MSCKSFNMCVVLDILSVTCPGKYTCERGMLHLDIWFFGSHCSTSYVKPKFPLNFNEKLRFHENFTGVVDLKGVQKCLQEKPIGITLVQVFKDKQITLATYKSNVVEVLYPGHSRLSKNGEMTLLMKNEPSFPGHISPIITLVTKTRITEQINTVSLNTQCSPEYSKTDDRPFTTKRVHHFKSINSHCFHEKDNRMSPNDTVSSNTCSDTNSQLCDQSPVKIDSTMDSTNYQLNQSRNFGKDMDGQKKNRSREEPSDQINSKTLSDSKHNSFDNNEHNIFENKSNTIGKNIEATFTVKAHHHKCGNSKLNQRSGANDSMNTSDEHSFNEDKIHERFENKVNDETGEEPRKITPKIKAHFHIDVYNCKCGTPKCPLSPRW